MMMGAPETRALVKNTFLEFVETGDEEEEEEQPRIWNSQTDSRALGIWNCRDRGALAFQDSIGVSAPHPGPPPEATEPEMPAEPERRGDPADFFSEGAAQAAKPQPDLNMSFQVLVKNTFLELVEEDEEDDEPQGRILKSGTDPADLLRVDGFGITGPGANGRLFDHLRPSAPSKEAAGGGAAGAEGAAPAPEEPAAEEAAGFERRAEGEAEKEEREELEEEKEEAKKEEQERGWSREEDEEPSEHSEQQEGMGAGPAGRSYSNCSGGARAGRGANAVRQAMSDHTDTSTVGDGGLTTLMLRNLPNDYTRDMLLELLDTFGFAGRYDFVYYPSDFTRNAGLGYAFVNMLTANDAKQVRWVLEGFRQWSVPSSKVCSVGWSLPCQGLEPNVERYRNSPVMHKSVPDEFKPVVFRDGQRVPFPKPTRKVRRPDSRKGGC